MLCSMNSKKKDVSRMLVVSLRPGRVRRTSIHTSVVLCPVTLPQAEHMAGLSARVRYGQLVRLLALVR